MQRPPRHPRAVLWSQPRRLVESFFSYSLLYHSLRIANLFLGVSEAAIIRNAGGRASDALRSIATLDAIAGVATIVVVHHTGERGAAANPYHYDRLPS